MTDLEMTKLCAEAMGLTWERIYRKTLILEEGMESGIGTTGGYTTSYQNVYDPFHDDAQAMELEDWLIEHGTLEYKGRRWMQFLPHGNLTSYLYFEFADKKERRRRLVECVAKMQAAKCAA